MHNSECIKFRYLQSIQRFCIIWFDDATAENVAWVISHAESRLYMAIRKSCILQLELNEILYLHAALWFSNPANEGTWLYDPLRINPKYISNSHVLLMGFISALNLFRLAICYRFGASVALIEFSLPLNFVRCCVINQPIPPLCIQVITLGKLDKSHGILVELLHTVPLSLSYYNDNCDF